MQRLYYQSYDAKKLAKYYYLSIKEISRELSKYIISSQDVTNYYNTKLNIIKSLSITLQQLQNNYDPNSYANNSKFKSYKAKLLANKLSFNIFFIIYF